MAITRWDPFREVAALQNRMNSLVSVENNVLTVKGERKFEKEENFHRIERRYGSFYGAFKLPTTVDTEHIDASYNAGVLKLELTKKPKAQPKQIKVNVEKPLAV